MPPLTQRRLHVRLQISSPEARALGIGIDRLDLDVNTLESGQRGAERLGRDRPPATQGLEQCQDRVGLAAHAACTSIFCPFASLAFGRWTSSTPLLKVAFTLSGSTPAGSARVRVKAP